LSDVCQEEEHVSLELLLCLYEDESIKSLCDEQDVGLVTVCGVNNKHMNGTVVQLYSDCAALDGPDRISVIDVIFI
jgi:hypothetical protein